MDLSSINLTNLSWEQFAAILVAVAAFDWVTGVLGALLKTQTFSLQLVLQIISTHGPTVGATALLFAVGQIGGVPALCGVADGLLAVYVIQTLQSAGLNVGVLSPSAAAQQPVSAA